MKPMTLHKTEEAWSCALNTAAITGVQAQVRERVRRAGVRLELIERTAALVPPPPIHCHRFYGVLARTATCGKSAAATPNGWSLAQAV